MRRRALGVQHLVGQHKTHVQNINARIGGGLAHSAGATFEKRLMMTFLEPLARAGMLQHFVRIHPEVIVVKRDSSGRALCQFCARSAADWVALTAAGVYVAMEAKSTAGDRLARKEISPQQEQHLDAAARAGVGLLLVELRGAGGAVYAVPWPAPWNKLRSADSLGELEMAPYQITHWRELGERMRKAEGR